MTGFLIDTHILVWWRTDSRRLRREHRQRLSRIEARKERAFLAAISLWELACMFERGVLHTSSPIDVWLDNVERDPCLQIVPISARIAAESALLGTDFHKDPADRLIVATARCMDLKLLTEDAKIRDSKKVALA